MLVLQRASLILACVLGAIIALIAFDFVLRLPSAFRLVLLLGGAVALAYSIFRYLRVAIAFSPSLTQLALRVERVFPAVSGRLASSVEFATAGIDQTNQMAARTVRETQTRLAGESVAGVIDGRRTWRDLGLMILFVAAASGLAYAYPTTASTGLTRLFAPYSDTKWPARTGVQSLMDRIIVAGNVYPRGQALPLRAKVTRGYDDQRVDAYYRLTIDGEDQPWQHIVLTHQASGVHERLVDTNAERIELYFQTDDDETSREVIDLVPPPAVYRASLRVTPPSYAAGRIAQLEAELGQGIDERAVTEIPSLVGSTVALRLELNKAIPASPNDPAWLQTTLGWGDSTLPSFTVDQDDPRTWTLQWTLSETRPLSLQLVDEHGLRNAEPIAYRIQAVDDLPPSVTITEPQADEAVLASAVVQLQSEARDDVALSDMGLEAHVQTGGRSSDEALSRNPAWHTSQTLSDAAGTLPADLDLGPLHVSEGDVVLVSGTAKDLYEAAAPVADAPAADQSKAPMHSVRSPVRRLRVISSTDFATQLRRQLGAVRQNAIRIEAMQAELQDDVIDAGVQPGVDRAQAQIAERIATQRGSVEDIARLLRQNRLDDPQLGGILQQSQDLLDYAGRAANKAVETLEGAQKANADKRNQQSPSPGQRPQAKSDQSSSQQPQTGKPAGSTPDRPQNQQSPSKSGSQNAPAGSPQSGSPSPRPEQPSPQTPPEAQAPDPKTDDLHEPAPEDRPIVEAQQEVRDELADLIKLLDRDEDTWVVKRQLENLLKEQAELEAATNRLGQDTIGQRPEDLPEQQRSELDRIAQKQRDKLRDEARKLIESMRERAEALEKVDSQSAQSMRDAADTAEQRQLDRDMEEAAKHVEQNQMTSATAKQQSAQSTMQQMLNNIQESRRAQAQQLMRQLASLVESIQRLIVVQENELTSLALAVDTNDFSGLDRSMIRLNQNTQAVAGEARAAGQEARRIARALDRAADSQGAAVAALRSPPVIAGDVQAAEDRSLALLKEAKALAEELQKQTQEQELQRRREELMEAYRKFAEQQVALRGQTLELAQQAAPEGLDRRQLVEARRFSAQQDDIRVGLNQLRDVTSEILDSPIFVHVHRLIDTWSAAVSQSLVDGSVNVEVTDRQQQIADSIGRLMKALEESMVPPDEFARDQQQGGEGGGQPGQQALIPPVAQLKLLQGIQEQVYNLTREMDSRTDLDEAQLRSRLRDLGQQQRELMDLGTQMLEALQGNQPMPGEDRPAEPPAPPAPPSPPAPEPNPPDSGEST
ncbi:MAG: hypothetical protein L0Y42_10750 [Phycisphaerales bacterium]|nr:hypothetical protein [Phycisphaerales bacterium]